MIESISFFWDRLTISILKLVQSRAVRIRAAMRCVKKASLRCLRGIKPQVTRSLNSLICIRSDHHVNEIKLLKNGKRPKHKQLQLQSEKRRTKHFFAVCGWNRCTVGRWEDIKTIRMTHCKLTEKSTETTGNSHRRDNPTVSGREDTKQIIMKTCKTDFLSGI